MIHLNLFTQTYSPTDCVLCQTPGDRSRHRARSRGRSCSSTANLLQLRVALLQMQSATRGRSRLPTRSRSRSRRRPRTLPCVLRPRGDDVLSTSWPSPTAGGLEACGKELCERWVVVQYLHVLDVVARLEVEGDRGEDVAAVQPDVGESVARKLDVLAAPQLVALEGLELRRCVEHVLNRVRVPPIEVDAHLAELGQLEVELAVVTHVLHTQATDLGRQVLVKGNFTERDVHKLDLL
eukprot:912463-Prorocentrum_minimum.AAC.2